MVFDSLRAMAPLSGASVVIPELARYVTTDARGRFQIERVPPGRYTITFLHPTLDSLDLAAEATPIAVPATGTVAARLTTPSPAATYARLCPGARDVSTGVLVGRVRDVDDGSPIDSAVVTADWMEYALGSGPGRVVREAARTNASGAYLLCGVPADVVFRAVALAGGYAAGPLPVTPDARLIVRLDFAVSRRDSAARLSVAQLVDSTRHFAPLASPAGSGSVTGWVTNSRGAPVRLALVSLDGSDLAVRTDSAGHFVLARVPAGTRALTVRAIGLAPSSLVVQVRSGASLDTVVRVEQSGQLLKEVNVLASRPTRVDRTGFDERVRLGLGHFLTEDDIEKRPAPDLYGFLQRVPELTYNITVVNEQVVRRVLMRGGSAMGSGFCTPAFFLDGTLFPLDIGPEPLKTLVAMAQTAYLRRIEVYGRSGTIPPQFDRSSGSGCGSVVIWTK